MSWTADLSWTPGDHFLHRWSAGSDDKLATLYSARGKILLSFNAPAIEVSKDNRYLIELKTAHSPAASSDDLAVYDLATARPIARRGDVREVTAIR